MQPDDLYGLALDQFVPERGALAKALRTAGKRDAATDVATLRKPSVAAWAVNQLVRTRGKAVQNLFDAGDALRAAQADLLAGRGDGASLRAANEHERSAVDGLIDTARGLLSTDGHELSATIVERVADTLHAAALDADAREQVREGRLERELRHVGLGLGEGAAVTPPAPKPPKDAVAPKQAPAKKSGKPATTPAAKRDHATHERAKEARAEAKRAEAERTAARKAARVAEAQARRRKERAASALRVAEERRERAADALNAADDALAAAQEEVTAAAAAHERAQAELDSA